MASWTVDGPRRLTIAEPVDQLVVRLATGRVNVVGTGGGSLRASTMSGSIVLLARRTAE
ncbi:hypothetical protein I0C86_39105 [Plantactinospora sp. S1510]|uniref:Uncharacterized protein n=1 Tax=Plantactinospora alkalitolerans TaxID=2789879 RepID=A0ABS0H8U6_9ACTN|nr:hypothetical protein [Plantactinospora alkalitolerans]MBF9134890.1 hypothetical protein [Plantactinospora alkalitolerans]